MKQLPCAWRKIESDPCVGWSAGPAAAHKLGIPTTSVRKWEIGRYGTYALLRIPSSMLNREKNCTCPPRGTNQIRGVEKCDFFSLLKQFSINPLLWYSLISTRSLPVETSKRLSPSGRAPIVVVICILGAKSWRRMVCHRLPSDLDLDLGLGSWWWYPAGARWSTRWECWSEILYLPSCFFLCFVQIII